MEWGWEKRWAMKANRLRCGKQEWKEMEDWWEEKRAVEVGRRREE